MNLLRRRQRGSEVDLIRSSTGFWPRAIAALLLTQTVLVLFFGALLLNEFGKSPVSASRGFLSTLWKEYGSGSKEGTRGVSSKWADEVLKGGYILHFRHAERAKFPDVTGFDAIELSEDLDGRDQVWADVVCLTDYGFHQSELIGEVFRAAAIQVTKAYTSPSCRARETCETAFGGKCETKIELIHSTAAPVSQRDGLKNSLMALLQDLEVISSGNVVLVGHGSTPHFTSKGEGGFTVAEMVDGELLVHHTFEKIADFVNSFLDLPLS